MQELKIQFFKTFCPIQVLGYHLQVEVITSEYPGSFIINCNHAFGSTSHYCQILLYLLTQNRKTLS